MRNPRKLLIVLLVLIVTLLSWARPLSEVATASVDAGLKRSVVSFASARALNGAISVLQGTEVAVQPVGVGVSLSVGEILDPINDLVESLSSVMLMASVAFGIQKLLLVIGSNWTVSAGVTAVALLWSLLFLGRGAPAWLSRLMLVLVFVRFVMPLTMIGSAWVFNHFSADEYRQSQSSLDQTSLTLQAFAAEDVREVPAPAVPDGAAPAPRAAPEAPSSGFWDWIGEQLGSAKDSVASGLSQMGDPAGAVSRKFEALKAAAETTAERIIRLIVVFLMQTAVVPLVLLWALYRLTVGLPLSPPPDNPWSGAGR